MMKKNFFKNLSKLLKSITDSTNSFFPKKPTQTQTSWWQFKNPQSPSNNNTFNQFKNIFSSDKPNQNDYLNQINQQLKRLSSKQNQDLLNAYKNKITQTTEHSKKIYDQKTKQIKSKLQETLKDKNLNLINEENLKLLKKKSSQASQKLSQTAESIKQSLQKSRQYIGQKSYEIPGQIGKISGKVYEQVKEKVDVKKNIEKSLSYIFWRAALLLGVIAFCYGLGTSLPKEIRSILKEMYKKQDEKDNLKGGN